MASGKHQGSKKQLKLNLAKTDNQKLEIKCRTKILFKKNVLPSLVPKFSVVVVWFYDALQLLRSFSARTKFGQEFTDVIYSLSISSSALHLIAERLASVTADSGGSYTRVAASPNFFLCT